MFQVQSSKPKYPVVMKNLHKLLILIFLIPSACLCQGTVNYRYLFDNPESHDLFIYASPLLFANQLSWETRAVGQIKKTGFVVADYRHAYVTSGQTGNASNLLKPYHFMEFGMIIPFYKTIEKEPVEIILKEEHASKTNYLFSFDGFTRFTTKTTKTTSIHVDAQSRLMAGVNFGIMDARLRKYFDDGTDPYKINDRALYGYTNVDFTALYLGVAGVMNHNLKIDVDMYGIRRSSELSMVSFDLLYALKLNADSMTVHSTEWGALNGTYHISQAVYGDNKAAALRRLGCRIACKGHFWSVMGYTLEFNWYPGISGKKFSFQLGFGLNIPVAVAGK
jgi:hypothetical protein